MPEPETNSTAIAGSSPVPCSLSSECVLTRDLKGRLGIQSAPEVFLCARVSIEDLIARHNELIRERDEVRADSRRLDWIDAHWQEFEGICVRATTKNFREMIDAEMASENVQAMASADEKTPPKETTL